ncbi:MAG: metallophosphoesterase [Alphaproteobacteria bacterium]|nr:metallophosphoesterase [Alphaproteobacteria bacterium]MCB9791572.1 metallophosphoesterase [Alphaproteobacteria bacterium]
MTEPATLLSLAVWLGTAGVVVIGALRGRIYAAFLAILMGIHAASVSALSPWLVQVWPLVLWLQAAALLHFASLTRPQLRSLPWRALVSLPGSAFVAAGFLALPWAAVATLGFTPHGWWLPFLLAVYGLYNSLAMHQETVDLVVADGAHAGELTRWQKGGPEQEGRPLRVVQITDPHLGSFMSVAQLARICEDAVAQNPDLIVLTGDFLTMESKGTPGALAEALQPLVPYAGRTFACLGNHDHEDLHEVMSGLAAAKVRLLVDQAALVDTPAGPVQILGVDFRWRDRAAHLAEVCARNPRVVGALRLVLLHDPTAFHLLPLGEADLALSGHTHGGQVGLVSLGLDWTFVSGLAGQPDHGFWARGEDRMYVHRGTGHYGFPLRLGVPAESSLLRVHRGADAVAVG